MTNECTFRPPLYFSATVSAGSDSVNHRILPCGLKHCVSMEPHPNGFLPVLQGDLLEQPLMILSHCSPICHAEFHKVLSSGPSCSACISSPSVILFNSLRLLPTIMMVILSFMFRRELKDL